MSKTKIKSVHYSIHECMKKHKGEFSRATFSDRTQRLEAMFKELHSLGYETTHIGRVKQKHIGILVKHWQASGVSIGSIKNRMSDLRFVCRVYNRNNVVKSNADYNIGNRCYIPSENKALHNPDFSTLQDAHIRCSIELQRAFGLRREECIKIIPSRADEGTLLRLKASWTKGGIERAIPIRTKEQRYWLERAKNLVGKKKSLIPEGKTYIQQRRLYDRLTNKARFHNLHGLRHAYAQNRYFEITGWHAPIHGGKQRNILTQKECVLDKKARMVVAFELGHARVAIAKNYLG